MNVWDFFEDAIVAVIDPTHHSTEVKNANGERTQIGRTLSDC